MAASFVVAAVLLTTLNSMQARAAEIPVKHDAGPSDTLSARDLGMVFDGETAALNAITDVAGITVGTSTLLADFGDGKAARTGVTATFPRGKRSLYEPVFASVFALNGNGEMTGSHWVEEGGMLEAR